MSGGTGSGRLEVDIRAAARENTDFRREVVTGTHSQVVVMSLGPGEDIGREVHEDTDQVLVFVSGEGEAELNGAKDRVTAGDLVFVPGGTWHNFVNTGQDDLKLYTIYAPPEHEPGTVHRTKQEADEAEDR